jgi:hypothetical protein
MDATLNARRKMFSTPALVVLWSVCTTTTLSLAHFSSEEFDVSRLNFTDAKQQREFEEVARFAQQHHGRRLEKTEHYVIDKNGNLNSYDEATKSSEKTDSHVKAHVSPNSYPRLTLQTPVERKIGGRRSDLSPYQRRIAENLPSHYKELENGKKHLYGSNSILQDPDPNSILQDPDPNSIFQDPDPNSIFQDPDPNSIFQDPNSASSEQLSGPNSHLHFDAEPTPPKVLRTFHPLRLDIKTRVKRFHINQEVYWDTNNITWSLFTKLLPANLTRNEVSQEIHEAFMIWQRTTSWQKKETILYFTQLNDNDKSANIRILFARGDHNDGFAFDGPGSVLAHAWFPPIGMLHLDADEQWLLTDDDEKNGTYLLRVVTHEIGHTLGLQHSSVEKAMMYAWYRGDAVELNADDVNGLEQLYVSNPKRIKTTTSTTQQPPVNKSVDDNNLFKPLPDWVLEEVPNSASQLCTPDTVACLRNEYYVFVDDAFWRYRNSALEPSGLLAENVRIAEMWGEMCAVDAVAEVGGKIMFVRKGVWYEYKNNQLVDVGRVDVMFGVGSGNDVVAVFQEQGFLYLVGNNGYVYKVDMESKKVLVSIRFRDKFRGVGRRVKWVTSDAGGVKEVGVGRGVWRMNVVTNNVNFGYVYEADGDIEPLLKTC